MNLLRSRKWLTVIIAAVICGSGTYVYFQKKPSKPATAQAQERLVEVRKGSIRSVVSGTSQFEAQDIQNMIAPVDGTIKTMNLTRNQAVKEGDILVEITDPSLEINLQEAQMNLRQLENDLKDLQTQQNHLQIYAPINGILSLSNLDTGSNVSKTTRFGTISDIDSLTVKLPFFLEDAMQLKKDDLIDLEIDGFMLTKTGTVKEIGRQPKADAEGGKLIEVEIGVSNDGTLDVGMSVQGTAMIGVRNAESQAKGTLDYERVETVFTNASGMIRELKFKSGSYVTKGELMATIVNDSLNNDIFSKQAAIERQKINIDNLQDRVNKLTIVAPFDGVFSTDFANRRSNVLASYPVGAKVEANTQFGAVASLDFMQLPIQVDELDLPKITRGMRAEVRVDSIPGRVFEGMVNQVSTVGNTTNGVTFFDVVLSVANTGELRYGMTGTAEIIILDKKDILLLPIEALQVQRSGRSVTLMLADGSKEEQEVKIGISNRTDVEVIEGLKEGDSVVVPVRQRQQNMSQSDVNQMRQMFQSGPSGGGGGGGNFFISPSGGGGDSGGSGGATQIRGGGGR